jgi:hypothetical protein
VTAHNVPSDDGPDPALIAEYVRPTNPWQADIDHRIGRLEQRLTEMSMREHIHPIEDKLKRWTGPDNSIEQQDLEWKERALRAEAELARLYGQFRLALSKAEHSDGDGCGAGPHTTP